MRRADHAAIFVFIAGTYTPFALLVVSGPLGTGLLIAVWAGALAGIARELVWTRAPRWLGVAAYIALGWLAVLCAPTLISELGWSVTLVAAGGVLYTLGAVVYALRRPDPWPRSFGYHEVFHALVIAAAALHLAVIALVVLPAEA
jgi:hemolysin III